MKKQTILVPFDFTQVTGYALEHAVKVCKTVDNDVTLLHIVKEESEVAEAQKKLHHVADEAFTKFFIKPVTIVRVGSIFSTIGEVADEVDASLVIMGTHGIRGMQKLTGSWALKVIVSSKVPFVVIQEPPRTGKFEKVVFPIDFRREEKEKNQWVSYLAKHYNSKFYLIKKESKDRVFKAKIASNLAFTRKFLDSKEVRYEIKTAPGKKKFSEETIEFAKETDADLILVMTTRGINLADYVLGADEQRIIANSAKIPVMCVNPRTDVKMTGGFSAMGG